MLSRDQIEEIHTEGFIRIENHLSVEEIDHMMYLMYDWRNNYYDDRNLKNRTAYLSDTSDTRISNAYMVSTGNSRLPHISVDHAEILGSLINDFQNMLMFMEPRGRFTDTGMTRLMLNMQEYKEASKPIGWHFDGEYLDFNTESTTGGVHVKEALVAKYVAVYTLYNDNEFGAAIKDIHTGEEHRIRSEAGDFFIFDNTRFLHSVPELEKPRAMFGFRNFDYNPLHYSQEYGPCSILTTNECFSGYVKRVTTGTAHAMLEEFIDQWSDNFTNELEAKF